jgi:membrane protease YdiL (CAAX protease family)
MLKRFPCDSPNRAIYLYLKLTLALSVPFWILVIWSGHLNMAFGLIIPALMWCPAIAAWMTYRRLGRDFRKLAWSWPKARFVVAAYLIPLGYASVAYGLAWATHLAGWNTQFVGAAVQDLGLKELPTWASLTICIILMATGGVIENLSTTLGEEIGWRGFLVPELAKRMRFTQVGLVSGLVWAAWHTPLVLFADYNVSTTRWYSLLCSSITCVSVSFILAWIRMRSGSIWPAALLHASHNLFIPVVFDNLTRNTGQTLWYTTQFGAALATTSAIFAAYFWLRRDEVEESDKGDPQKGLVGIGKPGSVFAKVLPIVATGTRTDHAKPVTRWP